MSRLLVVEPGRWAIQAWVNAGGIKPRRVAVSVGRRWMFLFMRCLVYDAYTDKATVFLDVVM